MKIGDRIRIQRESLNLSQDELARRLGYKSRSSINKIERDASGLPQTKIRAIANALNTTPAYIMGWEEEQKEKPTADSELSENINKLVEFAKSVPDDKIDLVLRVMKSILEEN